MEITIKIKNRKTVVTYNGKETEHKTTFLQSLSFKDFVNYVSR